MPAPILVAPAEVAPGGARAAALEAALVRVENVTVIDDLADGIAGETPMNEFVLEGGLSVDDQFFLIDPQPAVSDTFESITGVLRFTFERNKLLPRSALDVIIGPPALVGFAPETAVIYAGETGPSAPAIEVALSNVSAEPTFVAVTSGDESRVTVSGGGVLVPAGELSAPVELTGVAPGGPVTLTATLDTTSLQASVTVLDPSSPPVPISLEPNPLDLVIGQTADLTLTLSAPVPQSGLVVDLVASGPEVSVPATVMVPGGESTVLVPVTGVGPAGTATVTASAGGPESVQAEVQVREAPVVGLVLAEIFYNPSGSDSGKEWVKLFNGTGQAIDLGGWSLGWGGTSYTTGTQDLQGVVQPGQCFVVGGPTSDASNFLPVLDQAVDLDPDIQNGSSPGDGVALFHVAAAQITAVTVPADAVVYGSNNDSNLLGPDGQPFASALVGGTGSDRSLIRTRLDLWEVNDTPNAVACPGVAPALVP